MAIPIQDDPGTDPGDGGGGGGGGGGAPGVGDYGGNTGTAIFNVNFYKHDTSSLLKILVFASVASPDDLQFVAYVLVDGTVRNTGVTNMIFDNTNSNGRCTVTVPAYLPGISAGNHNIVFSIRNQEPDGALQVLPGASLEIEEVKLAGM